MLRRCGLGGQPVELAHAKDPRVFDAARHARSKLVPAARTARDAAFDILKKDPHLRKKEHEALREELMKAYGPAALAGVG